LMFTALASQLAAVLKRVTGRGVLSEQDVTEALREIRRHLLEADVSFEVTQGFVERVRERAVAAVALKTVSPGQQVVKLVHDEIARMLGASEDALRREGGAPHAAPLQFASVGPTVILLVGLQGSGKTTTAAKLARRLKIEQKAPGLVAADPYRPAAAEQLRQLGEQVGVPVFPGTRDEGSGKGVPDVVRDALREAEKARCRTVIVDTAGRLQIDAAMMDELKALGGAYPRAGRRGGAGGAGGGDRGRGGGAAARAEGALEARDGLGGLPGRAETDAGDGAAQAGAGPPARRERQGAGRRTGRRQAPEARGGDRAVDDAGGASRSIDPQRLAPPADRQRGGTLGAGREPAAGAVPADAEALEKDLGDGNSHSAAA